MKELKEDSGKGLGAWFMPLLVTGVIVNLLGLLDSIIEPDGALYATLAKEMALSGDFVNLKVFNQDWLDKPHFPFWITALSYLTFGINSFAYKFPAVLFWAAGAFYTYRLCKLFYNETIAQLSLIIYVSAFHLVLSNNDVRAEPYLMGLVTGCTFHFIQMVRTQKYTHLFAGALLAACAAMTKGIFVWIVPIAAVLPIIMQEKGGRFFLNPQWLIAIVATIILTLPEIACLYLQFDLHPEKTVFGQTHVSGVQFFLWESQFGRFFNNGPIHGKGDVFFFLHTTLWAFFPWALPFFVALIHGIRNISKLKELCNISVILIMFVVFSLSKFQLPHYINILFPFMAIFTARYLYGSTARWKHWWNIVIIIQTVIIASTFILLLYFYRPDHLWLNVTYVVMGIALIAAFAFFGKWPIAVSSLAFLFLFYGWVNLFLIPGFTQYQAGLRAAQYVHQHHLTAAGMLYENWSFSYDFYLPGQVPYYSTQEAVDESEHKPIYLFARKYNIVSLREAGAALSVVDTIPHYGISRPRWKFINYKTRATSLDTCYLVRITKATTQP